jgi:hypothetical protein
MRGSERPRGAKGKQEQVDWRNRRGDQGLARRKRQNNYCTVRVKGDLVEPLSLSSLAEGEVDAADVERPRRCLVQIVLVSRQWAREAVTGNRSKSDINDKAQACRVACSLQPDTLNAHR